MLAGMGKVRRQPLPRQPSDCTLEEPSYPVVEWFVFEGGKLSDSILVSRLSSIYLMGLLSFIPIVFPES
jgi:hypothetical protein